MGKKQLYINLAAQLVSFGVSFVISFFVSPVIVREVGKETYGFLGMANNFVSYVTIITVALNALAGRFVTMSFQRNDQETASRYFSSVFYSNLLVVAVLLIPSVVFISLMEQFLSIPAESILSVKVTFALVFVGFFTQLIFSVFSVATFATNKLYLTSIRTIEANVLRILVIVGTFSLFGPNIAFVSLAMLAYYSFTAIANVSYTRKLMPLIRVQKKYFDWKKIWQLLTGGCWSSITALSNVLLEGLDLLISNLMLGPAAMGTVSIVKTIPNMINQCMSSVLGVFTPQLTIGYAKGDFRGMISYMDYACKLVAMLLSLPVAFVLVFGDVFFSLWMPTENAQHLWGLSVASMGTLVFSGSVVIMYNLFTVTNNLKKPALVTLVTGLVNTVTVFVLLSVSDLGVYAIVAVSSMVGLLRNLLFNIPYAAKCIGQNPIRFYSIALRSLLFVCIAAGIGFLVKVLLVPVTWLGLISSAAAMCIVAMTFVFVVFFRKEEKSELKKMLRK